MVIESIFLLSIAVFLVAGTIKGVVGIGLPTASLSLLSQFQEPHVALALVVFPMCLSNAWQFYRSGRFLETAIRLWPFALMLMLGIYGTTFFTAQIPTDGLMMVIGVTIMVFSAFSLLFKPFPIPEGHDLKAQVILGAFGGVMGGLTTLWSPPMVGYLMGRGYVKDDFVRASGFLIFLGSIPLMIGFWRNGMMTGALAGQSALLFLPTLLGFSLGEWIRKRLDGGRFTKLLLVVFFLMGANILRKSLMGG